MGSHLYKFQGFLRCSPYVTREFSYVIYFITSLIFFKFLSKIIDWFTNWITLVIYILNTFWKYEQIKIQLYIISALILRVLFRPSLKKQKQKLLKVPVLCNNSHVIYCLLCLTLQLDVVLSCFFLRLSVFLLLQSSAIFCIDYLNLICLYLIVSSFYFTQLLFILFPCSFFPFYVT